MRRAIAPVLHSILGSTADVARCERRLTSDVMSGRESRSSSATEESTSSTWSDGESATGFTRSAVSALEKATAARREIFELWAKDNLNDTERGAEVIALITRYKLDVTTPREDDISRGLGDAMDRLLLLLVPLASPAASQVLENLLKLAARNGRQLSVRTIQHIFSRSGSYSEALAIFYAMRRANVAMDMESYFAMLYSLQRLEEEGWAERFGTEVKETGRLTEQALDFVVKGIDNQLLPESKPWLGRVMFADRDEPARRRTSQEFDAMGEDWVKRYRNGGLVPSNRSEVDRMRQLEVDNEALRAQLKDLRLRWKHAEKKLLRVRRERDELRDRLAQWSAAEFLPRSGSPPGGRGASGAPGFVSRQSQQEPHAHAAKVVELDANSMVASRHEARQKELSSHCEALERENEALRAENATVIAKCGLLAGRLVSSIREKQISDSSEVHFLLRVQQEEHAYLARSLHLLLRDMEAAEPSDALERLPLSGLIARVTQSTIQRSADVKLQQARTLLSTSQNAQLQHDVQHAIEVAARLVFSHCCCKWSGDRSLGSADDRCRRSNGIRAAEMHCDTSLAEYTATSPMAHSYSPQAVTSHRHVMSIDVDGGLAEPSPSPYGAIFAGSTVHSKSTDASGVADGFERSAHSPAGGRSTGVAVQRMGSGKALRELSPMDAPSGVNRPRCAPLSFSSPPQTPERRPAEGQAAMENAPARGNIVVVHPDEKAHDLMEACDVLRACLRAMMDSKQMLLHCTGGTRSGADRQHSPSSEIDALLDSFKQDLELQSRRCVEDLEALARRVSHSIDEHRRSSRQHDEQLRVAEREYVKLLLSSSVCTTPSAVQRCQERYRSAVRGYAEHPAREMQARSDGAERSPRAQRAAGLQRGRRRVRPLRSHAGEEWLVGPTAEVCDNGDYAVQLQKANEEFHSSSSEGRPVATERYKSPCQTRRSREGGANLRGPPNRATSRSVERRHSPKLSLSPSKSTRQWTPPVRTRGDRSRSVSTPSGSDVVSSDPYDFASSATRSPEWSPVGGLRLAAGRAAGRKQSLSPRGTKPSCKGSPRARGHAALEHGGHSPSPRTVSLQATPLSSRPSKGNHSAKASCGRRPVQRQERSSTHILDDGERGLSSASTLTEENLQQLDTYFDHAKRQQKNSAPAGCVGNTGGVCSSLSPDRREVGTQVTLEGSEKVQTPISAWHDVRRLHPLVLFSPAVF